jgi:hypothetical protein
MVSRAQRLRYREEANAPLAWRGRGRGKIGEAGSLVVMALARWTGHRFTDGTPGRFDDKSGPSRICKGPLETEGLSLLIFNDSLHWCEIHPRPDYSCSALKRDHCRIQVALEERK